MKKRICLDTGVIFQYFSKDCPSKVKILMHQISQQNVRAFVFKSVLIEVFNHLCKAYGKEKAKVQLISFIRKFHVIQLDLDESLVFTAGLLKCQHGNNLSYIDCISIAYCLNNKVEFHTTEKLLKKVPGNTLKKLKVVKYEF